MSPLLAEEVGLHLGDGSMNYYNGKGLYQLRGHMKDDKNHYEKRIKYLYKEIFNLDLNLREMPSCGVYGFQIWSNELIDFKYNILKLPLGKKRNFSIPKEIIKNKKFWKYFLRGYFDTDGCLYLEKKKNGHYPRIEMATISITFSQQLKELLDKMGFNFSYYKENRKKHGWQDLYRIIIRGNKMVDKWFSEINPKNQKHLEKYNKLKYGPAETLKSRRFVVSIKDI